MKPGKLDAAGMAVLSRPAPFRPERTADERRIATLEHQVAVLRECLTAAMGEVAFAALPTGRQELRRIRAQLGAAGIEVPR